MERAIPLGKACVRSGEAAKWRKARENRGRKFCAQSTSGKLTKRQLEVAVMLAAGETVKAAAIDLGISNKTVECYFEEIKKRLRVDSKIALCRWAIRNGLLDP